MKGGADTPVGIFSILSKTFVPSITCAKIVYFPTKGSLGQRISRGDPSRCSKGSLAPVIYYTVSEATSCQNTCFWLPCCFFSV